MAGPRPPEDGQSPRPKTDGGDRRPRSDADGDRQAAWGWPSGREPRWPASLAVVSTIALFVVLPHRLILGLGPNWLIPVLEGLLLVAITVAHLNASTRDSAQIRVIAIVLIALINVANVVSLAELVNDLLDGTTAGGRTLVYASVPIWITNVIVFALWYWELDRGGPVARLQAVRRHPDFLFPQMGTPQAAPAGWTPSFFDYLYTSFTNATAFSPTDTMPLTAWAKLLMMIQSLASLLTVALVVSRAVNILSG